MAVYREDNPEYFQHAVESMLAQTVPADEIVLVCDGELTEELDLVIKAYEDKVNVVRLEINKGLGEALNEGLRRCRNELVARMDSDDISLPDRCEKQLKAFEEDEKLDIVSGTVEEFFSTADPPKKKHTLPLGHEEIIAFSRKRCPFNHPAVMYKKSSVTAAGGYHEEYHLFEDYDLWVRMMQNGAKGRNLPDVLLRMRVSDASYQRRGGLEYTKNLLRFHNHLRKSGWIGFGAFSSSAVPHAVICMMPNSVRKRVYRLFRTD